MQTYICHDGAGGGKAVKITKYQDIDTEYD